jgi:hypothetical protein
MSFVHWHFPSELQLPEIHSSFLQHDAPTDLTRSWIHLPAGAPWQTSPALHCLLALQASQLARKGRQVLRPIVALPVSQYVPEGQSVPVLHGRSLVAPIA